MGNVRNNGGVAVDCNPHLRLSSESDVMESSPEEVDDLCPIAVIERTLDEIDEASRRIDSLAKNLNVLGYFDDDPGRPRAA